MPRTTEQFELMRKEREESILNAGLYLFATKGFEQTTADAICAIVNCSHGLLYHYYASKDELYKAVIEKKVRPIVSSAILDYADINQKAKFAFMDITDRFLKELKSDNDEFAWCIALLLDIHLQTVINPKIKDIEKDKKVYDWVYELIERGKKEGDFNDIDSKELVLSILALYKGLSYNRIKIGHKRFLCPHTDIVMKMVLK